MDKNLKRTRNVLVYMYIIFISCYVLWGDRLESTLLVPVMCLMSILGLILLFVWGISLNGLTLKEQKEQIDLKNITIGKKNALKSRFASASSSIVILQFILICLQMINAPVLPEHFIYIYWASLGMLIGYKIAAYSNIYTQKYLSDKEEKDNL